MIPVLVGVLLAALLTPTSHRNPEVSLVRLVSETVQPSDSAGYTTDWLMADIVKPEQEVWTASFEILSSAESGIVQSQRDIKVEIAAPDGKRAAALRLLEDDFGLPHGSVTMYCPESRMNSKIAEVRLFLEGNVVRFDQHEKETRKRSLSAGHLTAQLDRFASLWKIGFFIDPEIKQQKGKEFTSELRKAIRVLVLGLHDREDSIEIATARIAREVVAMKSFHFHGQQPLSEPKPLVAARGDASTTEQIYPLGARSLRSFVSDGNA